MNEKGQLGSQESISHFAFVQDAHHQEFSDMCMLTPLKVARATGATGKRDPSDTAREIEERTWEFVTAVMNKKKDQ